jgi:Ca2+-transporting ATPase
MQRPPRSADAPLFSRGMVGWAVAQGCAVLAMAAGLTLWFWHSGLDALHLRSVAFLALVLAIVSLILVNRRRSASLTSALRRPNPALAMVLGSVAVILAAAQYVPSVAGLFAFAPLLLNEIAVVALCSGVVLLLLEQIKQRLPIMA